jgi:RNA 2',3'-cyclic 3'-phosphodiesterase
MRVFVAFACQKKVGQILDEFAKEFRKSILGSFTRQYHCTLGFLGEVDEQQIDNIHKSLSEIHFPRFRCTLSSFGAFGDPASILYASVESIELKKLQHEVTQRVSCERKEFIPHITIARIQKIEDRTLLQKHIALKMPAFHFDVDEIILYKSIITEQGSQYEPLHTYLLEQPQKILQRDFKLPKL